MTIVLDNCPKMPDIELINMNIDVYTLIKPEMNKLRKVGIKSANLDCRLLLSKSLDTNKTLYNHQNINISENEMKKRKEDWVEPKPRFERGYGYMYSKHIEQANKGCDFDFLRTDFGSAVKEPDIN